MDYRIPLHKLPWLLVLSLPFIKAWYFFVVSPARWFKKHWDVIRLASAVTFMIVLCIIVIILLVDVFMFDKQLVDSIIDLLRTPLS